MYISGDSLLLGKHQFVPTLQELSLEEYRKEDEDFASLTLHVEKTSPQNELFLRNNPKVSPCSKKTLQYHPGAQILMNKLSVSM